MATKTLAQVQTDAQNLAAQIAASGVNAADRPSIVTAAKGLLASLNDLTPHINDAQSAFGNQQANVDKLVALKNQLNKVIATYSS